MLIREAKLLRKLCDRSSIKFGTVKLFEGAVLKAKSKNKFMIKFQPLDNHQ